MFDKLIRDNLKAITKERNRNPRSNSEVETFDNSGHTKDTAHSSAWYDEVQSDM